MKLENKLPFFEMYWLFHLCHSIGVFFSYSESGKMMFIWLLEIVTMLVQLIDPHFGRITICLKHYLR